MYGARLVKKIPLVLALLLVHGAALGQEQSLPSKDRPVQVAVGFFLVNLSGVAEVSETFDADVYLSFRWRDSRLAFQGTEPQRFLEDGAVERLKGMWWPQIEFVNTGEPQITNRALEISPDGSVLYMLGVTSSFRSNFDLRRFPFDEQQLHVRIQSFLWTADQMAFVPDAERIGFAPDSTFEGLDVREVGAEIRRTDVRGWGSEFSEFVAMIDVSRRATFYVWTLFAPLTLIFLISCTAFAVPIEAFQDRVAIGLAALLACIATQFAMSFNLPQISYLTVIDRLFVVTYFCVALGVATSTYESTRLHGDPAKVARVDLYAGIGLPILFFVLMAICLLW